MENWHMSIKSHYPDEPEFDYDMVYVTQFHPGKLWVVWKEMATGNTLASEFEIEPD